MRTGVEQELSKRDRARCIERQQAQRCRRRSRATPCACPAPSATSCRTRSRSSGSRSPTIRCSSATSGTDVELARASDPPAVRRGRRPARRPVGIHRRAISALVGRVIDAPQPTARRASTPPPCRGVNSKRRKWTADVFSSFSRGGSSSADRRTRFTCFDRDPDAVLDALRACMSAARAFLGVLVTRSASSP